MNQIQTIKTKAKLYRDYTAICLSEMVQIPSLSAEEEQVVLKIKEQLEDAGLKEVRIDSLGNLIAKVGNGPKILAIDAHIDTVDTGDEFQWETPPFSGLIKDGYVHGRGTVDQEGGAAAMLTAARILTEMEYDGEYTIYFTFTVMEEDCDGMCWLYLIEKENISPDVAVITEPTNLGLYRGHRGRMEMEVHISGLSCHGSAPERGKNVIYSGARTALAIEQLHEQLKNDAFLGKGSIAPTVFRSNSPSLCAVPDVGFMHIDRRLTWGETKESAVAEIQNIIGHDSKIIVPEYDRPSYKGTVFTQEKYFPTWKLEEDHPLVQAGRETCQQLFDEEPRIDKWTFSTNGVALCGKHQIPCIGFGPGNEIYAHAPNEKVPVDHLEKATAFYALLPYILEKRKL
ncbi:MAG: YgeY family selenium metabolism-linked hydrolase [Candidatus Marinimicrobia bacterium]|nr:YgeY family selenium metabolism-linked hydrolase [Candidatus Neomarinimicrobiota bacterium]